MNASNNDHWVSGTNASRAEHGFVVNVIRLSSTLETLNLVHEFIKNTAIAAITLVAVSSPNQAFCTCIFLVCIAVIYMDHEIRYDRLAIADLEESLAFWPDEPASNHNRFLQALTGSSRSQLWKGRASDVLQLFILGIAWFVVLYAWDQKVTTNVDLAHEFAKVNRNTIDLKCGASFASACSADDDASVNGDGSFFSNRSWFARRFFPAFIYQSSEMEPFGMQVMVLTVMHLLHYIFNMVHWYETSQTTLRRLIIVPRRLTNRPPPLLDPLNCLETRSRSFWRPSIQTLLGGGLRPPPRRVSGRGSRSFLPQVHF